MDPNIKEVVKEKYGQAALRVTEQRSLWLLRHGRPQRGRLRSDHSNLYDAAQAGEFPKWRCKLRSVAAIRPRLRN